MNCSSPDGFVVDSESVGDYIEQMTLEELKTICKRMHISFSSKTKVNYPSCKPVCKH